MGEQMSFVYVAANKEGVTKVGRSINPLKRIKAHVGFTLLDSFDTGTHKKSVDLEQYIIRRLKPFLVEGNEWFKMPESVNPVKTFRHLISKGKIFIDKEDTYLANYKNQVGIVNDRNQKRKTTPDFYINRALMYKDLLVKEFRYDPYWQVFKDGDAVLDKANITLNRWSKTKAS